MNEFQERLQELIDENNTNRLQLSKQIKISSTTINGYFNKDYYPKIDIAINLANHFGCSLDYLFGLTDNPKIKYKINIETISNNLVKNLNQIFKENKISISDAMNEMNLGEYDYYRWKDGKFPRTINLLTIAKHFDVSIDYLIGRSDEK